MTAQQYFQDHSINEDFASNNGVTWDDNEVHIQVYNELGQPIFKKHRNLQYNKENPESQKYRYDSGSHAALFNYHAVKEKSYMVISEGEIDCLRLNQEGIPSVSSTGGSQKFDPAWTTLLESKQIFICYDTDSAGHAGVKKILELLPEAKVVQLPPQHKDVCDFFVANKTKGDFIALMKQSLTKQEWEKINEPEDYKQVTASEIRAMVFEEEPWLIEKIIYSEGFCFIYGGEGVGKSFLTLSIAKAIITGEPWLGEFKVARPGKVLFLDKENPTSIIAKRLMGMDITGDQIKWLKYPEKFQLSDGKGGFSPFALAIARTVKEENIDLIIIDSFVDLMVGTENKAEDTQAFFDALRQLFPKKAFLPLHHENKPSQGVFRSDSQRMRGSSNINAQTNTMFRLEAVAKSKTELTLKQTKSRDAQRLDKFMIQMVVEDNEDGSTRVTGFKYLGVAEAEDNSKAEEARGMITNVLAEVMHMSRKEIILSGTGASLSEALIEKTLKKMVDEGILEKNRIKQEVYYSLAQPQETSVNDD